MERGWQVALDSEGKLLFPSLPSDPGMYRLAISEKDGTTAIYVGEADELRRRFAHTAILDRRSP